MKNAVKITTGKSGFFLSINGKAIKQTPNGLIEATETLKPNNWFATEFASLQALRAFWANYRILLIHIATK